MQISSINSPSQPSPIDLLNELQLHHKSNGTNPASYMVFKESKRALKELAKKGELSEELRSRVLSILNKRGLHYRCEKGPRFGIFGVSSTEILFRCPRLWHILNHPESHPKESALINSLSDDAFQKLLDFRSEKSSSMTIESFVEFVRVVTLLNIPELENIHKVALLSRLNSSVFLLNMKTFYQLVSIFPDHFYRLFATVLSRSVRNSFPQDCSNEEVAAEFELFNKMIDGSFANEKENLSAETLFRFFLFAHNEGKGSHPLHVEVFGILLERLKSGDLDPSYSQVLVNYAEESHVLRERMKKDSLVIELEGIGSWSVSVWPLFAKSDYIRTLLKSGLKTEKVVLEGNIAKSFFILYDLWIKAKQVDLEPLSVEQLIGLLQGADFFKARDFSHINAIIGNAIVTSCDNDTDTIAALAEIVCSTPCQEVEDHVISWLKKNPIFSIQEEAGKYSVSINLKEPPPFATLQSGIRVLKILLDNHRLSNVVVKVNGEAHQGLMLLCGIYCCFELGLAKEKEELEGRLSAIRHDYQPNPLRGWSHWDVLLLLRRCTDSLMTHILEGLSVQNFCGLFWWSVKECVKGKTAASLKEEAADIERIVSDRTGNEAHRLTPSQLPYFLHSLFQTDIDLEQCPGLLNNFVRVIREGLREKTLDIALFEKILEECRAFSSEKVDFIRNLKIGVQYSSRESLEVPVHLLLKMESCQGKLGAEFESIPLASAVWAVQFIEMVFNKSEVPLLSEAEAKTLPPAHFLALKQLQRGLLDEKHAPMKSQAYKLESLVPSLPHGTLMTAAAWALSVDCQSLFDKCSAKYCGSAKVQFKNYNYHTSRLHLSSFESKPLRLLKVIGDECRKLWIDVETDATDGKNPWAQVVEACPNLTHLSLMGRAPMVETLPLSDLKKLEWLTISARDESAWEEFKKLKIPPTIPRIELLVSLEHLKEAKDFEIFKNLPSKGVRISLWSPKENKGWFSSVWNLMSTDPVAILFSTLTHFKTLEVDGANIDSLNYIIKNNLNLEEVNLKYENERPYTQDIQTLVNRGAKKCNIQIGYHDRSGRNWIRNFLNYLDDLRGCNLEVSLYTGQESDKDLREILNEYKKKDRVKGLPEVKVDISLY
ncbi:MAG: hypothetical protein JSS30_08035 [Verrucomicrobia bacterium]|nr:hypothetical protein [Verrucomicrobiota bacterium]